MRPFRHVVDVETLSQVLDGLRLSPVLALDLETTGLDPHLHRPRLLQIADGRGPVAVCDLQVLGAGGRRSLNELLTGTAVKVFHNGKFDLKFLLSLGLKPRGPLFDTMLASQLLDGGLGERRHSLEALARDHLGLELDKELQLSDWSGPLSWRQLEYAARDADVTFRLRRALIPLLIREGLVEAAKVEFDCLPAVAEMEYVGMGLDRTAWAELEASARKAMEVEERRLLSLLGDGAQLCLFDGVCDRTNLDSQKQVLEALRRRGLPLSGTSRRDLLPLAADPAVAALLDYRRQAKLVQAFGSSLLRYLHPRTERVHPDYRQIGAATGRFACRNPNLQQIPRDERFRRCFTAPPGRLLFSADYSQIELRVVAQVTRDATMTGAFRRGWDLHRLTASLMTGRDLSEVSPQDRQAAKAVNFGLVFAMGAARLAEYAGQTFGVALSDEEARLFRERFFRHYGAVARWHESFRFDDSLETRTLCGRLRRFRERPRLTERCNAIVQGTAADILKKALAELPPALEGTGAVIVGSVHDEILVEGALSRAEEIVAKIGAVMEKAGTGWMKEVPTPVSISLGRSWGKAPPS